MRAGYLIDRQLDMILAALTPANRLVCRVMLHTGLRISDVVELPREAVKFNFTVTEKKTRKRRRVRLSPELVAEVLAGSEGSPWAFPSPADPQRHRTRQAVWKDIKRAQRAFRLNINAAPHSMRKVYAVELMHKYGDIDRVRRALNHDHYDTTFLYALADQLPPPRPRKKRRLTPARGRVYDGRDGGGCH